MRIIQISDTHLSLRHRYFAANLAAVARWLAAEKPDLIINTGDLSMDGARLMTDHAYAAGWHDALGVEVLSVPGNHDVGDLPHLAPSQPVNAARLADWQALFGPDHWLRDLPGWRLIGLDAMVMGSGLPDEAAQEAWLAEAVRTDARLAVFLHKPLFIARPDEPPGGERPMPGYWPVPEGPRGRILGLLRQGRLAFVSSGHLHIAHRQEVDGVTHWWCPSCSFVCGPIQDEMGGARTLGVLEHVFTPEGVQSRVLRPEGMADLLIDPVGRTIYAP